MTALAVAASIPLEKGLLADSGRREFGEGRPYRGPRLLTRYLLDTEGGILLLVTLVGSTSDL